MPYNRNVIRKTLAVTLILVAAPLSAQQNIRRATNIEALITFPGFFHQRPVVVVGELSTTDKGELRISGEGGSVHVVYKEGVPDGLSEIRGDFWDLGRMKPDDPRLANINLPATFHVDPQGVWPRPGEVMAIMANAVAPAASPPAPSIRAIVLNPGRYLDQKVTIKGQFEGRNLAGDLPDAPAVSKYDFVLRSTDAAIWVTNMRPKGKDPAGKDFELSIDARTDTGKWLEVAGVVKQVRGLQYLEATAGSLALARAPVETPVAEEPLVQPPPAEPPEVVFSVPTDDESDVSLTTHVRIQFSRDIDPATLKGKVKASYLQAESTERGELDTPTVDLATKYASRTLEVTFSKPLERFRTLRLQLLDGIKGTDGQPLKPWTLKFVLGGS